MGKHGPSHPRHFPQTRLASVHRLSLVFGCQPVLTEQVLLLPVTGMERAASYFCISKRPFSSLGERKLSYGMCPSLRCQVQVTSMTSPF
ncbi:hypothetical protein LEMLEM_LOCUS7571 [Lemmus lemmus]